MVGVLENPTTLRTEEDLRKWLESLRSGAFEQGTGALCRVDYDGNRRLCCIGVLDEVVLGTSWTEGDRTSEDIIMVDSNGEEGNVAETSVAHLGLDRHLTEDEAKVFQGYEVEVDTGDTRVTALAMLNDNGADFDTIAMVIESLGWDKANA